MILDRYKIIEINLLLYKKIILMYYYNTITTYYVNIIFILCITAERVRQQILQQNNFYRVADILRIVIIIFLNYRNLMEYY